MDEDVLVAILFVILLFITACALLYFIYRETHKDSIQNQIKREKKFIKEYQKEHANDAAPNAKTITKIIYGKSDKVSCPYCGRNFNVSDGTCPSCGAVVQRTENEIVFEKIEEHQELLKSIEYRHKDWLETLKAQRSNERREALLTIVIVIVGFAFFWLILKSALS